MNTAEISDAWERYATAPRTPRREVNAAGAKTWFNWTSHADHGPDETLLGPMEAAAVLELGSGAGCNLAHLATLGAFCTGLDVSPTQTAKATERWGGDPRLEFFTCEAVDYLGVTELAFDAIYSVFGAAWFTDPAVLLPLVHDRLVPGGVFAFSQTAPADARPVAPGAQVIRYDLDGDEWTGLLLAHGFTAAAFETIDPPAGGGARTLLVHARARGAA
jgi:SAM-dependent methyltransferase